MNNTMDLYAPLSYIPVRHSCGHFELRFTRWRHDDDRAAGYLTAASPCSQCDAQGRPVQPNYNTLAAAQDGWS